MWYIGQKVVCIDADSPGNNGCLDWVPGEEIYNDEVYTIKSVHMHNGVLVFHLFEVERSERARYTYGDLVGYGTRRFRPLLDKKTDISIFTDILKSVTKKEPENV